MDNKLLMNEIKDVWLKTQETINLLKDGKQIIAYHKLLGISQKLSILHENLSKENENNTNT
jgi:hypothetical protein